MSNQLSIISETLFVPMLGRIYSSKNHPSVFNDEYALALEDKLPQDLLTKGNQDEYTLMASAVRSRNFDQEVKLFLQANPDGVVVELGCGLETTFLRCDNGRVGWYLLDLPEVLDFRKTFLPQSDRNIFLPSSMLDTAWMEQVKAEIQDKPVLILAEGLFYYFPSNDIIMLIQNLSRILGGTLVFDTVNSMGLRMMGHYMKQVGHKDASMFFYVDKAADLAKQVGGNVQVIEERPFYQGISRKEMFNLKTRLSMTISDWLNMVKIIKLSL